MIDVSVMDCGVYRCMGARVLVTNVVQVCRETVVSLRTTAADVLQSSVRRGREVFLERGQRAGSGFRDRSEIDSVLMYST